MKKKHKSLNFIFLEICIIFMYLFSFYETGMFQGSVSPFVYIFEVIMTVLTITSIVICVKTSNKISKIDSLTGIGNVDWIMAKVARCIFRKNYHSTQLFF